MSDGANVVIGGHAVAAYGYERATRDATDPQLGSIGELGRERARIERGVVQPGDPAERVEETVRELAALREVDG